MNEAQVQSFWQAHPCGDHQVGGLDQAFARDYETFFREYDAHRYRRERHILKCLDGLDIRDKRLLEIGLGQGAEFRAAHPARRALVGPRSDGGIRRARPYPAGTARPRP